MSLWKDKPSQTWKYTFQINGKVYGGGGFKTKGEARAARENKRSSVMVGQTTSQAMVPTTDMAFAHLADLYLDGSQRRHAEKTFKYKRFVYANFLRHAGDLPVNKITPYLIQDYLQTRASNSNYNRHRKDLGALFEYARKVLGVVQVNPCNVIEKLPEEKTTPKIPTQEEFIKIFQAASEDESPLLLVLAYTAARVDEALRLRWADINFKHSIIKLWTRKTKDGSYRDREIPMKDFMKSMLMHLWEIRKQDQWVFFNEDTVSRYNRRPKMMKAICQRAGIPHYGFHSIRHFVCSYLLDREKIGKPTVSKMLGHQSLSTTDLYAHSINVRVADDALDMAMDKLEAAFVPKLLPTTGCSSDGNR
ncbi:MAG: site-specific integrase [Candidatus Methanoperedens sp.]|nr:site-specific integrase [Candidatus Methanoperedens sp.]